MFPKNNNSSVEDLSTKFITILKVKNINDKTKIFNYIQSVFSLYKSNVKLIKEKLLSFFEIMTTYEQEKELSMRKKLYIVQIIFLIL